MVSFSVCLLPEHREVTDTDSRHTANETMDTFLAIIVSKTTWYLGIELIKEVQRPP